MMIQKFGRGGGFVLELLEKAITNFGPAKAEKMANFFSKSNPELKTLVTKLARSVDGKGARLTEEEALKLGSHIKDLRKFSHKSGIYATHRKPINEKVSKAMQLKAIEAARKLGIKEGRKQGAEILKRWLERAAAATPVTEKPTVRRTLGSYFGRAKDIINNNPGITTLAVVGGLSGPGRWALGKVWDGYTWNPGGTLPVAVVSPDGQTKVIDGITYSIGADGTLTPVSAAGSDAGLVDMSLAVEDPTTADSSMGETPSMGDYTVPEGNDVWNDVFESDLWE